MIQRMGNYPLPRLMEEFLSYRRNIVFGIRAFQRTGRISIIYL